MLNSNKLSRKRSLSCLVRITWAKIYRKKNTRGIWGKECIYSFAEYSLGYLAIIASSSMGWDSENICPTFQIDVAVP